MKFNPTNNNFQKPRLINSPYFVELSKNVKKSLDYAIKNNFLEIYDIKPKIIIDFFNNEINLPIWIIEATCNYNLNYTEIPPQYQYLWFCLHNTYLTRTQPSGRKFKTKVNFTSCYIHQDKEIKILLSNAMKKVSLPLYKFSLLCGYKKSLCNNKRILPLMSFMKICQILNIDMWSVLTKRFLFSKTNRRNQVIIPSKLDSNLMIFLVWLKTEGHIELGSTHIEINQKNSIQSLYKLKLLMKSKFKLRDNSFVHAVGTRGEDRLIVSSSALKQLLCLKYDIFLGYKTGSLKSLHESSDNKLNYARIMPAFIETEGCLSYSYTRDKKKKLPRFEFIVKDQSLANDCLLILEKLGFKATFTHKQNIYKVGMYNHKEVIRLIKKTEKYFFDTRKIDYLKKVCTNGIGL